MTLKFYLSLLVKFSTSQSLTEYFLMLAKLQNSNLFSRKVKKSTHLIHPWPIQSMTHHRPILLLPVISKIYEKVVGYQTNEFLHRVSTDPGKSWKVLEFEKCPGKSWDLLIFLKNPGKVLEFSTIFVRWIFFCK